MNTFSAITAIALALLIVAFTALLFLTIIFNVKAGAKYREPLAEKLQTLRLNKMLSALGIDTYEYLHKENVVTIHQQMDRCTACVNTVECDDNLSSNTVVIEKIDFCNNESSLKKLLNKNQTAD